MTQHDRRPTILVVDDDVTIRRTMSRLLERAGYRVRTAGSGEEAVALVRSEHFDAAVCDLLRAVGAICPLPSSRPPGGREAAS